ncbi:hypothetical protein DSOL_3170 [Desulfosporosinus metallidurans]|uniref:Uncharacterized protein n=1 Tax=Desulfosporosinus metallidurans TaxID=1888891 RepID=A0A1Q8QSC7_9FIRM|nr:hypothetical protein DSOL_3170 [Desulfosporosinus metallidurans]
MRLTISHPLVSMKCMKRTNKKERNLSFFSLTLYDLDKSYLGFSHGR